MHNEFCQLLGIRYPIIQAPMAGVSTPELAAAVSNAGALGSIAIGASAVQLGTAYLLCPESATNALYRAKLKSPLAQQTRFTSAISGRPARGLTNSFYQEVELNAQPKPWLLPQLNTAAKILQCNGPDKLQL